MDFDQARGIVDIAGGLGRLRYQMVGIVYTHEAHLLPMRRAPKPHSQYGETSQIRGTYYNGESNGKEHGK